MCWGVAGGNLISSNLAQTKDEQVAVLNPTVLGKKVYALFGFVSFGGFSKLLRALDRDIMIIINDIAKVAHDEVYRWALGEHEFAFCIFFRDERLTYRSPITSSNISNNSNHNSHDHHYRYYCPFFSVNLPVPFASSGQGKC